MERTEQGKSHKRPGDTDTILCSIPTIASGLILFLILFDKSFNNFMSTADGTVRSVSGCDNAINTDDKIDGSKMVNMYGDEVITAVNRTSVVGD